MAGERREHQGEGLFLAVLQLAQAPDRFVVVRRDHEMEAAEPFDGDDLALANGVAAARLAQAALPAGAAFAAERIRPRLASEPKAATFRACPSGPTTQAAARRSGQALGWAWKRRSRGSSYSAWHCGHIVKPFIEVFARS